MRIEERNGRYDNAFKYSQELLRVREIISEKAEANKVAKAKAALDSHITENELATLREQVRFDELAMAKQNDEIEIAQQANQISELELETNRYANILLIAMLILFGLFGVYVSRIFILSKRRNVELDYLATHDSLTDCFNRRGLFEIIERVPENAAKPINYSFIMVDIDNFKAINDGNGHDVGDQVLKNVAIVLQSCMRNNDIVARYGGEEFCIAVADIGIEKVERIAETMRKKIEEACFENISVTCSFGIASINSADDSPMNLISKADQALYYSKANGRNQVNTWNKTMSSDI
jgi:diguanylate cyclase (GGDEF)-like protein